MGRGLGSSAAARVSGVLAAHLLHCRNRPDRETVYSSGLPGSKATGKQLPLRLLGGLVNLCAYGSCGPNHRVRTFRLAFSHPETTVQPLPES